MMEQNCACGSYGIAVNPSDMANACLSAKSPSGWEEINNRLGNLITNIDRVAQESHHTRMALVASVPAMPSNSCDPETQPGGDFIALTLSNISHIEGMLASIYTDIQDIRDGRM